MTVENLFGKPFRGTLLRESLSAMVEEGQGMRRLVAGDNAFIHLNAPPK